MMCKKLINLTCLLLLVSLTVNNAYAELIGWWKFDGDFVDSSGNGNIATPVGNPYFVEGMLDQAVSLNSTTTEDYINCGPNMGFATIGDGGEADGFSIAAWVNRTVAGDDHKICSNLSVSSWAEGAGFQFAIFRNRTELDMRDSTGRFFSRDVDATGFTEMEIDTWYHIVFVFDDVADTVTEYIDGVKTHTIEGVPTSLAASPVDFMIGSQSPTFHSGRVFRGLMDDFRLYSNAVTEEEVQTIMQGGSIEVTSTAAMVVNDANLPAGFDQAQKDRLESLGYTVTITTGSDVEDGVFTAADAETFDVLVVSESIGSSQANNLIGANVPMMHQESYGWSRHFFTQGLNKTWKSDPNGMVDIVNDTHPIIVDAGLSAGPVQFFTNPAASWTTDTVDSLVAGAENLAQITNADGVAHTIIFAIEAGTELADPNMVAANRVVGFSLPGQNLLVAGDMTDEAWALFDAAIRWLDPAPLPPLPMVAHWPMDEGAGTVVADVVGDNDGTMVGLDPAVAWIADGALGGAVSFDNTNGHNIVVPHAPELDFGDGDFSISLWLRYPTDIDITGETDRWICKGTYGAPGTGKRYEFYLAGNDRVRWAIDDDVVKSRIEVVQPPFLTGDWVHAVAIRNTATKQMSVYADGVLVDVYEGGDDGTDGTGDISNGEDMRIGDSTNDDAPMLGDIDDVRIFDKALTEDEIGAIY